MDFEHSEMLLYQNMILRESGKKRKALKHLEDFSKYITDKLQVKELQGIAYFVCLSRYSCLPIYLSTCTILGYSPWKGT